jgi:hypothetical protein
MMSITRLATAGDSWTGLCNHPLDCFLALELFRNQSIQFCLYRDYDGKVSPDEVALAAMYLKDTLGKEGIQELIQNLSKDKDGKILVEDLVKLASEIEDAEAEETDEPTTKS